MTTKYLFLDIDGVLNHEDWWIYLHNNHITQKYPRDWFDPGCIKRVNEILNLTEAKLVLASSWRMDSDIKEVIKNVGIPYDFEITPRIESRHRGQEVELFLEDHPCDDYVIIDDETDILENQKDHFFQAAANYGCTLRLLTENKGTGLTEELKNKIINYLNRNDTRV